MAVQMEASNTHPCSAVPLAARKCYEQRANMASKALRQDRQRGNALLGLALDD